jgi:exosortase/archaeosortase family protein
MIDSLEAPPLELPFRTRRRKSRVDARTALVVRIAVVAAATIVAYHYSLETLIRDISVDSPLAYLGLVPFITVALMLARGLPRRQELEIHDRYVDYIVGLPLLLLALTLVVLLPVHESTYFWLWRIDLLSPPFFVGGAIAIVFGVRALWRMRLPVAFLLLAWPLPYSLLLTRAMDGFTNLTTSALAGLVRVVPLAQPVSGSDGVFGISHNGTLFQVSVASACTGINGVVGFLLIGSAFAFVVSGPRVPKAIWLTGGMAVVWVMNLARILMLFEVGRLWGESVALDWFHPLVGLVTFNLGILVMIATLPFFHLRIASPPGKPAVPSPSRRSPHRDVAVPRAVAACAIVLMLGIVAGVANGQMGRYQLLAQDLGTPRLNDVSLANAKLSGWSLQQADAYPWVRQYFGPDAIWTRYEYDWQAADPIASDFKSNAPVVMDVISTSDLNSFSTFGLEDCYHFHNYNVLDARTIDLGGGVTGHALTYHNPSNGSDWLAVYWEWPVLAPGGDRYERVVMNMLNPNPDQLAAPPLQIPVTSKAELALDDWLRGAGSAQLSDRMAHARDFLIGFSQQVVSAAASNNQ